MAEPKINIPQKELAEFCQKYHIKKLAFFGSVLRDDFRPESDIDIKDLPALVSLLKKPNPPKENT